MLYFTSDTHFFDRSVDTYCRRPYGLMEENVGIFENIKSFIKNFEKLNNGDTLFILGDLIAEKYQKQDLAEEDKKHFLALTFFLNRHKEIRKNRNIKIHLVKGNHDILPYKVYLKDYGFESICEYMRIKLKHDKEERLETLSSYSSEGYSTCNEYQYCVDVDKEFPSLRRTMTQYNIILPKIFACHDPSYIQMQNTIGLCGHVHNVFKDISNHKDNTLILNVCPEVRDYEFVSLNDIISIYTSFAIERLENRYENN